MVHSSRSGEEEVTIEVLKETTEIVLNSIELKISSVEFKAGDKALTATKIDYDEKRETATFTFDQTLPVGAATLKVAFTGILNDKLKGYHFRLRPLQQRLTSLRWRAHAGSTAASTPMRRRKRSTWV